MDDTYDDTYLRRQLDDLRNQVDQQHHELSSSVDELSDSVDDLRRQLEVRAEELEQDLNHRIHTLRSDQEQAQATLERRLRWIERHIRATAGAATTRLDSTPDLIQLAQRAELAKTLGAQLLEPYTRARKHDAVKAWEIWQTQHRTRTEAAITSSRTIASSEPDHLGRSAAEETYRAARRALADLAEHRDRIQQAATVAAQELNRDDKLRRAYAADIAEAEQAWTTLTTRLRTHLVDAIDRAELLPVWFDTVLGMTPPPDSAEWLQAGTGVPPRFRTPDLLRSGLEWRDGNAGTAQEVHA